MENEKNEKTLDSKITKIREKLGRPLYAFLGGIATGILGSVMIRESVRCIYKGRLSSEAIMSVLSDENGYVVKDEDGTEEVVEYSDDKSEN